MKGSTRSAFGDPQLAGPTPLTIEDDRVFGHVALWGTCHVGIPGACVTPPMSHSGYRYFHLGGARVEDGSEVDCGQITLDTGHPPLTLNAQATVRHYDHTGTVVADIRCGDDAWGIWFSGRLRPDAPPQKVEALRAAKLSGDWRDIGGSLELVGVLAVNVPGFPVPRPTARVASGATISLVAAGVVPRSERVLGMARERLVEQLVARATSREALDALFARIAAE